jgi:predicted RecB family nuclease
VLLQWMLLLVIRIVLTQDRLYGWRIHANYCSTVYVYSKVLERSGVFLRFLVQRQAQWTRFRPLISSNYTKKSRRHWGPLERRVRR